MEQVKMYATNYRQGVSENMIEVLQQDYEYG